MRTYLLTVLMFVLAFSAASAVPDLQLWVDGTYDFVDETWIIQDNSFNLYLISDSVVTDPIYVSLALTHRSNYDPNIYPTGAYVDFDGTTLPENQWLWGTPPIEGVAKTLSPHGVYPTWYAEHNTGSPSSGLVENIGDVQPGPDYWNPNSGGPGPANHRGYIQMFSINVGPNISGVAFDAYTKNRDGSVQAFAPYSHDAGFREIPEPATMILFGIGLFGTGIAARRRLKK